MNRTCLIFLIVFISVLSAFHMRFPRDEWDNALKYYQSKSRIIPDSIERRESITNKKQDDDKKENESHRNDNEISDQKE